MEQQHTLQPKLRFPEFEEKWNSIKLGDLMTFKNGVNASKENYGFGYKFINVLDIINNNIITNDIIIGEVSITEKEFEKNIVQYGDILFQRSSETREEVGQSNVYLDETPATFGGFVIRGKSISEYNSLYLHYLLKTSKARLEITTKSGGSTRFNVGQETLSNVVIKISSSLPEQQKIADYLSTVDNKINLLEEKKAQLALYKKAMMQKLFSQEIRFKPSEAEALEAYPEWEEKRLGEIISLKGGYAFKSDLFKENGIPIMRISNISNSNIYIDENNMVFYDDYKNSDSYKVYTGELLIALSGATTGKASIYNLKNFSYVNQRVGVFKSLNKCYYNFIVQYIFSSFFTKELKKMLVAGAQPNISTSEIESIILNMPNSIEEQQKIADFLSAIDESIKKVNEQITQTQSFKKAMLQQMFV